MAYLINTYILNIAVIKCPDPGSPEHGHRIGDNFEGGAKVRFKCFSGYYLLGSYERYCKPNGQWTGELSRCDTPSKFSALSFSFLYVEPLFASKYIDWKNNFFV